MDKKFEVLPLMMPNFVRFKKEAGLRQDGFKVDEGFPISSFTIDEAYEYAELMKQTFIVHWQNKTAAKGSSYAQGICEVRFFKRTGSNKREYCANAHVVRRLHFAFPFAPWAYWRKSNIGSLLRRRDYVCEVL